MGEVGGVEAVGGEGVLRSVACYEVGCDAAGGYEHDFDVEGFAFHPHTLGDGVGCSLVRRWLSNKPKGEKIWSVPLRRNRCRTMA